MPECNQFARTGTLDSALLCEEIGSPTGTANELLWSSVAIKVQNISSQSHLFDTVCKQIHFALSRIFDEMSQ